MVKLTERFTYHPFNHSVKDTQTGEYYDGNSKTCKLLNQLNNQLEQIPETIKKVWIQ